MSEPRAVPAGIPAPAEVHLWSFELTEKPGDSALLAPDEATRAARFHFERDRTRFVAGRAELRRILGSYLAAEPVSLRFRYGQSGKPWLEGPINFNLSHSGQWAALAVARFELGVDIEQIRPLNEDVAGRFFAADEVERLRRLPPHEQLAGFYRCWTRKEAYVKAIGNGLSLPLDRFSVSLEAESPPQLLRSDDNPAAWRLYHFEPAPGIMGAIAARQHHWRVMRFGLAN